MGGDLLILERFLGWSLLTLRDIIIRCVLEVIVIGVLVTICINERLPSSKRRWGRLSMRSIYY